jgi:hypothetical protein
MSYWELFITTICNLLPFLKKISNKRWYKLPKSVWVIFDDKDGYYSNEDLEELGFMVLDYRRKKNG